MDTQTILAEKMEEVQWHGDYFSAICPFPHFGHKETHPSMLVYADGFYCKGCGRGGKNLEYLLSQVDQSSSLVSVYRTAKPTILPKWRTWEQRYGDLNTIVTTAHRNAVFFKENQWWFKKRQIDQFIKAGHFGYLDGWALFPVHNRDEQIVDVVVRATKGKGDTKYVLRPDDDRISPNLYVPNWDRVIESESVYIVYGIVDAWALEDIDLPCVTGTTGKSLSPVQLKPLNKKWIIVPDRYEEDAGLHLANQLGWGARMLRIPYPEDTKDPDNIRTRLGKTTLLSYLRGD